MRKRSTTFVISALFIPMFLITLSPVPQALNSHTLNTITHRLVFYARLCLTTLSLKTFRVNLNFNNKSYLIYFKAAFNIYVSMFRENVLIEGNNYKILKLYVVLIGTRILLTEFCCSLHAL